MALGEQRDDGEPDHLGLSEQDLVDGGLQPGTDAGDLTDSAVRQTGCGGVTAGVVPGRHRWRADVLTHALLQMCRPQPARGTRRIRRGCEVYLDQCAKGC